MISKARTKFIKSLQLKKYRLASQAFIVEGTKSVGEVLSSGFRVLEVYGSPEFLAKQPDLVEKAGQVIESSAKELSGLGTFRTNDGALAVVETKPNKPWTLDAGYGLLLDGINDPGNLGTIIRIADWFGLKGIVASPDVPDIYNPKVIAASKGSFTRIPVYYTDIPGFLSDQSFPAWGADLDGENVRTFDFPATGWIVMGSEAHGISAGVAELLAGKLTIPASGRAESLNVAMAAAVICDNLRRNRPA